MIYNKNSFKKFLLTDRKSNSLFILVFSVILVLIISSNLLHTKVLHEKQTNLLVEKIENIINIELLSLKNDTRFLSNQIEYILNNNSSDTATVKYLFSNMANCNPLYHQIRLIDNSGQEIIRYENDTSEKKNGFVYQLQNKKNRYYFIIGKQLKDDEVLLSRIDLNIEHNELEIPYRPMIRTIALSKLNNKDPLILVINFNVKYLFEKINSILNGQGTYFIINEEGYFLLHPNKEMTYGFLDMRDPHSFTDAMNGKNLEDLKQNVFFSENTSHYYIQSIDLSEHLLITNRLNDLDHYLLDRQYYLVFRFKNSDIFRIVIFNKMSLFTYLIALLVLCFYIWTSFLRYKISKLNLLYIEKNSELSKYNHTLQNLINIASHDFRSPYGNIISLAELMQEKLEKDQTLSPNEILYLSNRIKNISYTTLQMLDNMLLWSKLQINEIVQNPVSFDIDDIIEPLILFNEQIFESKKLNYNYQSNDIGELFVDRESLSVILRNLISNASKFANKGGTVKINVFRSNSEYVFEISDNGIGMSKEQIKALTDSNLDFSIQGTSGEKGHGIGMRLAFEYTRKLKGYITIESELEKGSVFKLHMPQ